MDLAGNNIFNPFIEDGFGKKEFTEVVIKNPKYSNTFNSLYLSLS